MTCQQCNELLEDYLTGKLPIWTKVALRRHLAGCSACRSEVRSHQMIHQSLQQLGIQPCPDDVILRVLEILQIDPKSSTKHSFGSRRPGMAVRYRWRWATVALIVIIGAMIVVSPKHGLPPPEAKHYTDAEIQQAKDQVRFTISWLRQVQIQTQKALEDQIFPQQVIKPLRSSLSTALKPLFNGEKR